ncbi:MAG: hypothetical protein KF700_08620, partial [Hyphomonadaceae bacterium]|nr:hypothetical protein [Hyphomonadaceae bacterium]
MRHNPFRALVIAGVIAIAPAALAETGHRFLIAQTEVQPRAQGDVLEVAAATGQFTRFLAAVEAAG